MNAKNHFDNNLGFLDSSPNYCHGYRCDAWIGGGSLRHMKLVSEFFTDRKIFLRCLISRANRMAAAMPLARKRFGSFVWPLSRWRRHGGRS
jgi:galactose-1-phosphate uridylyltransferase